MQYVPEDLYENGHGRISCSRNIKIKLIHISIDSGIHK